jgi:Cof subfamily protein (haloacid dehalogenase superfamily)
MPYRLLALDVDGTLLDPHGVLRPAVQEAVTAVQARGLRVTLCTGRRFRTALPIAQKLGVHEPLVVHNGALLKDPASGNTIQQCYMPQDIYHQGLAFLRQLSTPMVYIDAFHEQVDILTETLEQAHPFQREYLAENLEHCQVDTDIDAPPAHGVVMMSIMADPPSLHALRDTAIAAFGARARLNVLANKNYQGSILEILHPDVSKWYALRQFAAQEGIAPEEIIAVGDDHNDVEMLRHAGLGIAMGNAAEAVQEAADYVTESNAEDGLALALDHFVLRT